MSSLAGQRYAAEFARIGGALPGRAPWLVALRESALAEFMARGFPALGEEDWKYTSLAPVEKRSFASPLGAPAVDLLTIEPLVRRAGLDRLEGDRLVFVNGSYAASLSSIDELPAGATVSSLAAALDTDGDVIRGALSRRDGETVLGALNAAFMTDGLFVHLRAGVVLPRPLHVLFVSTGGDVALQVRNVIVAEARSGATVIEHYVGVDDAAHLTNAVTRIVADEKAVVVHCKVQEESAQALHLAGVHAVQGRESRIVSHSIALGSALARNDITTRFDAPGCHATLNGLYVVGGRQHVDHHTRIDHAQPGGTSREYYRGVLDGRSRGVFNGKVIVHPHAQGTDAQQTNHNLLLSRDAEVDTKPQLEIYADDVKCTHGATVGQLDEGQIFYLRSRGVDERTARSVLTYAFALDVVQRIEVPTVRDRLARMLLARLPEADRLKELA